MNKLKIKNFFKFFKKYQMIFLVCFVINIIIWISFYYFHNNQKLSLQEISITYDKLIDSESKNKNVNDIIEFVKKNHNTYGILASFRLTEYYIQKNNLQKAIHILMHHVKHTKDSNLKAIINIQLARILLENNQIDASIKILTKVRNDAWINIVSDIYGDALFDKGNIYEANKMWNKGIYYNKLLEIPVKEILKMKINNLILK